MFIDNRTPFAIRAMCAPIGDTRDVGFTTFRACYHVGPHGLEPAERAPAPNDALSSLPTCIGTSWSLAGTAVVDRPARELRTAVAVTGRTPVAVRVLGDRTWQRRGHELWPSEPLQFDRMPLGCERAFGGTVRLPAGERDGMPHPALVVEHPSNPRGRGYFIDARDAEGHPCPNIELATAPLGRWPTEPDPAVLCPESSQLVCRLAHGGSQLQHEPEQAAARLCHPAHWRAFGPPLRPGDAFQCDGFRPRPFAFSLPASPLRVDVRRAGVWHPVGFHIRHVHVALDQARIEIVFAHAVSYAKSRPIGDMRIRKAA